MTHGHTNLSEGLVWGKCRGSAEMLPIDLNNLTAQTMIDVKMISAQNKHCELLYRHFFASVPCIVSGMA